MTGDRNTRYYHIKTIQRRRANKIKMIKYDNGSWIEEAGKVKSMFRGYYHNLFTTTIETSDWQQTRVTYP